MSATAVDYFRPVLVMGFPLSSRSTGHFGLAGHGTPIEFRNIFVKEIDADTTQRQSDAQSLPIIGSESSNAKDRLLFISGTIPESHGKEQHDG